MRSTLNELMHHPQVAALLQGLQAKDVLKAQQNSIFAAPAPVNMHMAGGGARL
jgi:hypothetical protein